MQGDSKIPYVHVQVDARTDSRLPHAEQPALDPASSSHDIPTTRLAGFKANPFGGLPTTLTPGFSSIPSSGPKSTSSAGFPTPSHQRPESSLPDAGLGISQSREHRKDSPIRREVSVQTDPLGGLTHPEMCELEMITSTARTPGAVHIFPNCHALRGVTTNRRQFCRYCLQMTIRPGAGR